MFQFNASPFIQPWESASVDLNWLFLKVMGDVIDFGLSKDADLSLIFVHMLRKMRSDASSVDHDRRKVL